MYTSSGVTNPSLWSCFLAQCEALGFWGVSSSKASSMNPFTITKAYMHVQKAEESNSWICEELLPGQKNSLKLKSIELTQNHITYEVKGQLIWKRGWQPLLSPTRSHPLQGRTCHKNSPGEVYQHSPVHCSLGSYKPRIPKWLGGKDTHILIPLLGAVNVPSFLEMTPHYLTQIAGNKQKGWSHKSKSCCKLRPRRASV